MPHETVLTNARIVTAETVIHGHLVLHGELIAEIGEGPARTGQDMDGDTLIPGLVE
ncbi:MAG: phosphonate metabolism protein PhnM, partial [Aurantimonas sp.]|nr:phosphonate metabolism protein PhnM [Aurantimonas sp.]